MPVIESPKDAHVSAYQFVEQATDIDEPASGLWRLFFKAAGAYIRKRGAAAIRLLTESDLANLTFPTGARLKGNFYDPTKNNRVFFQSDQANKNTVIGTIPNGAGTMSGYAIYGKSDPDNSEYFMLRTVNGLIQLVSDKSGSVVNYAPISFFVGAIEALSIFENGYIGLGGVYPTAPIDVNNNTIRLRTARTPASAGAAGNQGDICWDANYLYVCTATNTWKRLSLSSW